MVILGMGTNLGDRLAHLRKALHAIKNISGLSVKQVSPVYISDALLPEKAPPDWNVPYLNCAVRCETHLDPYTLLSLIKNTEKQLGRTPQKTWGPRMIDIDLLVFDDLVRYDPVLHIPHELLHERPFALWPLADVAPHWVYPLKGPLQGKTAEELANQWGPRGTHHAHIYQRSVHQPIQHRAALHTQQHQVPLPTQQHQVPLNTQQIQQRIDTPQLMGIVNITPDSFSTDGLLGDPSHALNHIHHLIAAGADIIDIGAEATGPAAVSLKPQIEWERLEPLLQWVLSERPSMLIPPKISIDTRHQEVAERALALGVDWINDVSGLEDKAMQKVVAKHSCDIVFMHHLGIPADKNNVLSDNKNVVNDVYRAAEKRLLDLEKCGLSRSRLIFDVGIGYGKTAEQSLELIKQIAVFRELGVRLLVGHSRKSFLTQFTHHLAKDRDIETSIVSQFLALQAIDFLRVHNVDAHARAFKVMAALAMI
jgi:2-amino-4-hydroxy-6-hydroxymethyldihydropteridine diphosphokinase / dihydropteroate synthase